MRGDTVTTVRWLIVGVGMAAGIALIATGATLLGAVLLVMAGLRLALLLATRQGRRPGPMLRRLARNELAVAAGAIGIAPDDLARAVDDGRTISAVAADAGVPSRRVVDAVVRDATAKVDHAVA